MTNVGKKACVSRIEYDAVTTIILQVLMILSFILKRSFQAACGVCTGLVSNYIPVATKNRDNATARAGGGMMDFILLYSWYYTVFYLKQLELN